MKKLLFILVFGILFNPYSFAQEGNGQKKKAKKGQKDAKKGQYEENEDVDPNSYPYTIFFNLETNKDRILEKISEIQTKVNITGSLFEEYYDKIFNSYASLNTDSETEIGGHGYGKDAVSPSAKICKNAAFVYLMGFNEAGGDFRGDAEHVKYKTEAIKRLQWMNIKCGLKLSSQQWVGKDLLMYIQAYDLLKTAEYLAAQDASGYSFSSDETPDITSKYTISLGTSVEWSDTTLYISADIIIQDSATLDIDNSTIVMMDCSKIIVERGGYLKINNSSIGGCEWKGIEVRGQFDGCGDEYPDNNYNQPVQGRVYVDSSYICYADIGIFAGKRGSKAHNRKYGGGVVNALNSQFKYNYVDIMFSENSFAGICSCADSGATWHSDIRNNIFDLLSDTFYCDPFVDSIISKYNWYYTTYDTGTHCDTWTDPGDPDHLDMLPSGNCHIIDLSPFTDIWIYLKGSGVVSCPDACKRSA